MTKGEDKVGISKKIVGIVLCVAMVVGLIPNLSAFARDNNVGSEYAYVMYANDVQIKASYTSVNGQVYSKNDEVNNEHQSVDQPEMIDRQYSIIADYIFNGLFSDNDFTYTNELNQSIGSLKNIIINRETVNSSDIVLYSRDGNITINSDNFNFKGLIYAPNGTVNITGKNINIDGIIISDKICINAKNVNINKNIFFANYLGNESDKYSEQKDIYTYNYNIFGQTKSIYLNDQLLVEYVYSDSFDSSLLLQKYGNGTEVICNTDEKYNTTTDFDKYVEKKNIELCVHDEYKYDKDYNIIEKSDCTGVIKYFYNEKFELVKTKDDKNGNYCTYKYDNRGNITAKKEYNCCDGNLVQLLNETVYHYDSVWKDKLVKVGNNNIAYDEIGNPIVYRRWNLNWQNGRQLKSASNGMFDISYSYDNCGVRTGKIVNSEQIEFYYINNNIVEQHSNKNNIIFKYDKEGSIIGAKINGQDYYYIKSYYGDIEKIIDKDGNVVVEYYYDPWGKVACIKGLLADTIGVINPIRYRGYYYDNETELYYLQSRYYDPDTCRFINSDDFSLAKNNLSIFAYCSNNPVRYVDNDGMFTWDPVIPKINSGSDYYYFTNIWLPSHPEYYFSSYAQKLGYYESGNNYRVTNKYGYLGYWQLGKLVLQDLGYKDYRGIWTTKAKNLGIYKDSDFLGNPSVQDRIFVECCKKQWTYIKNYRLTSYVGRICDGVKVTESGLLAACHLIGAYGMKQVLVNGKDLSDAFGTKPGYYLRNVGGYNINYIK